MKNTIHTMLVEDNPDYREVIELTLADESDLYLYAVFGTAEAALQALQDRVQKPDIILLDINLPGLSGIDAIPQVKSLSPESQIIMLTQSNHEADVLQAIRSGATGYLLKSASIEEITQGIRTVADGGSSLDASVAKYIIDILHTEKPEGKPAIQLSQRESEILTLLSEGFVKKQIANQLGIGLHTVGDHVKQIYRKLNVPNAPAAVSKGFRSGILHVKDSSE